MEQLATHIHQVYRETKNRHPFQRFHEQRMEKLLRYYTNNRFVDDRDIAAHFRLIYRQKRIQKLTASQFLNLIYLYSLRMIEEFKKKEIRTPQPVNIKDLVRRVRVP